MKSIKSLSALLALLILCSPLQVHAYRGHKAEGMGVNLNFAKYWTPQYAFNNLLVYQAPGGKTTDATFKRIIAMTGFMWFDTVTVVADAPLKKVSLTGTELAYKKTDREWVLKVLKPATDPSKTDKGTECELRVEWNKHNPVKDLKVLVDGDRPDALFNKTFLEMLKPVETVRMMDWQMTNGSKEKNWSDRARPFNPFRDNRSVNDGVPLEWMIELCNETGCDLWYNIPHEATDEYIAQAANMIRERLDTDLQVYVEYSNEVWNTNKSFRQSAYALDMAKRQNLASGANEHEQRQAFYAKRSHAVFKTFKGLLGDRALTVFATQGDWFVKGKFDQLEWGLKHYSKYDKHFDLLDGVSPALYFGGMFKHSGNLQHELERHGKRYLLDKVNDQVERLITRMHAIRKRADELNAKVVVYEAGQHVTSDTNKWSAGARKAFIDFQTSKELMDVYRRIVQGAQEAGIDLIVWYTDCTAASPQRCFGHRFNPRTPYPRWNVFDYAL